MKATFLFSILTILFSFPAIADIREIQKMEDIEPELIKGTLLVFDLDNTIMRPTQTLGTDQWFDHLVHEYVQENLKKGLPEKEAISKAIDDGLVLWNKVQRVTRMQLVERTTASLVAAAQKNGKENEMHVMALTARPLDLADTTRTQLKTLGVDFRGLPPTKDKVDFKDETEARFIDGIAFIGPKNSKGPSLVKFLKKIGLSPRKIVFVDDKERHVISVDASTKAEKIPAIAFRYGAADAIVKAFDPSIAKVQLQYFGGILSDSAAKILITNK